MKDFKYVLFIFNELGEDPAKPKELNVLQDVCTGTIRGASCGALNLSVFPSDKTKEEISKKLRSLGINFFLFEEKDAEYKLPHYIARMFGQKFDQDPDEKDLGDGDELYKHGRRVHKPAAKLTLEDQLQAAIDEEDFKTAAILRDKIAKAKETPTEKNGNATPKGGHNMKQLFD